MNKDNFTKVTPVHRYSRDGRLYEQEYSFDTVHLGELDPSTITTSGVETQWETESKELRWKYKEKQEVVITEDGVFVENGGSIREAEKQAYFSVSILESKGLVTGWLQKTM